MRPTGLKTYSSRTCREWEFDWLAKDLPMHDAVCFGISDHLPYHLTIGGGWGEATYDWNPQISIDAPILN
jgi:hypothetical protein